MNIAIVDDSKSQQKAIEVALKAWADNARQSITLSIFESGESFIEALNTNRYDLVFMDIYMTGINGIEASLSLRKHSMDTLLIFMTTSTEHMAQAFPCHAFDYILKPVDPQRLNKTLDEALKLLPENQPYLNVTFEKQNLCILYSDIISVLSSSNYCVINSAEKQYKVRIPFNSLSGELDGCSRFFVINRGIIVNLDNVSKFDGSDCIMSDNSCLPVSRRKKAQLEQAILDRQFEKRRKGD